MCEFGCVVLLWSWKMLSCVHNIVLCPLYSFAWFIELKIKFFLTCVWWFSCRWIYLLVIRFCTFLAALDVLVPALFSFFGGVWVPYGSMTIYRLTNPMDSGSLAYLSPIWLLHEDRNSSASLILWYKKIILVGQMIF